MAGNSRWKRRGKGAGEDSAPFLLPLGAGELRLIDAKARHLAALQKLHAAQVALELERQKARRLQSLTALAGLSTAVAGCLVILAKMGVALLILGLFWQF